MKLCKAKKKIHKNLNVCFDIDPDAVSITTRRERIQHRADVEISYTTKVPDPIVFNPISPTNKDYQRIRGILPPKGYTVQVNGEYVKCDLEGNFSKQVALNEGINVFEVQTFRGDDRSNIVRVIIEKDTVPPVTEIFANSERVQDRAVTNQFFDIKFRVQEKSIPTTTYYQLRTALTATEKRAFSGNLFIEDEDIYDIEYWSIDSVGNEEAVHKFAQFVIDRTPPTAPEIAIDDLPAKTNQSTIHVHGSCSHDTVTVLVNGERADLNNETWTVVVPLLVEGINYISAVAYDEAENPSVPATASIIRDQRPPEPPRVISYDRKTRASKELVTGSQSEDTYRLLLNGEHGHIVIINPVRWRLLAALNEGDNHFQVIAEDDVGNQSLPLLFTITKDTMPPPPPSVDPYSDRTNDPIFILTGTASDDTAKVLVNGQEAILVNGRWHIVLELEEGLNEIELIAEDDVGNQSTTVLVIVELDSTPPRIPSIDPVPFYVNVSHLPIAGDKSLDTAEILVNGTSVGVSYPSPERWQKILSLVPGVNTIQAQASDDLGNTSQPLSTFTQYLPGPVQFSIKYVPPAVLSPSVLLDGEKDELATILVGGATNGVSYPEGLRGTKWTAVLNLEVGTNTFFVQAIDPAGNRSIEEEVTINRQLPRSLHRFFINSVYAVDGDVKVEGKPANRLEIPTEKSNVYFLRGTKPRDTKVFSNLGNVLMPDGIEGDTWEFILPVPKLRLGPVQITLQGDRVLDPPVIMISSLLHVRSKFVGSISFKIGGTIETEMPQNSSIIITDFQLNNTPSPIANVPIVNYLDSKPLDR